MRHTSFRNSLRLLLLSLRNPSVSPEFLAMSASDCILAIFLYYALVNELIPECERARANGALQLLDSIPRSGGPYVTGVLMSLGNMSCPSTSRRPSTDPRPPHSMRS